MSLTPFTATPIPRMASAYVSFRRGVILNFFSPVSLRKLFSPGSDLEFLRGLKWETTFLLRRVWVHPGKGGLLKTPNGPISLESLVQTTWASTDSQKRLYTQTWVHTDSRSYPRPRFPSWWSARQTTFLPDSPNPSKYVEMDCLNVWKCLAASFEYPWIFVRP